MLEKNLNKTFSQPNIYLYFEDEDDENKLPAQDHTASKW